MLSIYTLHVCMHQHTWQRAKGKRINTEGKRINIEGKRIKTKGTLPNLPTFIYFPSLHLQKGQLFPSFIWLHAHVFHLPRSPPCSSLPLRSRHRSPPLRDLSYCLGILTLPMGYATVQGWLCGGSKKIQSTLKSWWGSMLGSGYSFLEYRYARLMTRCSRSSLRGSSFLSG